MIAWAAISLFTQIRWEIEIRNPRDVGADSVVLRPREIIARRLSCGDKFRSTSQNRRMTAPSILLLHLSQFPQILLNFSSICSLLSRNPQRSQHDLDSCLFSSKSRSLSTIELVKYILIANVTYFPRKIIVRDWSWLCCLYSRVRT